MNRLETLLDDIATSLDRETTDEAAGIRTVIVELGVEIPIETRFVDRELWASPPRTRMKTGFEQPSGRLQARFVREPNR